MCEKKTITVKYEAGHSCEVEYEKTIKYCPVCGAREVWKDLSGEDYYQGASYVCTSCNSISYLDLGYCDDVSEQVAGKLKGNNNVKEK